MTKPIAIIAGEPNSISSEIIFKSWKQKKNFTNKPFFVIGSFQILKEQKKKLNYKINLKKINKDLNKKYFNNINKELLVYDIDYKQKKPFEKISTKSNKYIFNCFNQAIKLINKKKILGFINCPISKETLFKKKHQGITEYLAKKANIIGAETMLIYNKNLAVSPLTTHIPIKKVSSKIKKETIDQKTGVNYIDF